ncbi:MAG: putative transposase [Mycobacterium sp.]|jgi:transposase-like protein|nr:putative transposase [Mycobacterium sp.]
MREIYTAPSVEGAELALKEFDRQYGQQYPGAIDTWRLAWNEFVPFLDYPVELRKIVYTTNTIVIWSSRMSVFDVRHGVAGSLVLPAGRGYLQPSSRQSLRRKSACYTGGLAGLVA